MGLACAARRISHLPRPMSRYLSLSVRLASYALHLILPHSVCRNLRSINQPRRPFAKDPCRIPAAPHRISLYPRIALLNRQEGTVVVRLLVLSNGEVGDVNLVKSSGYPQLDAAALIGAGDWRYLPAIRNGRPVRSEVEVAIRFKLAKG